MISQGGNEMKYGVRWQEFNRQDQLIGKQKFFKTAEARDKFISKLAEKNNFSHIEAMCD